MGPTNVALVSYQVDQKLRRRGPTEVGKTDAALQEQRMHDLAERRKLAKAHSGKRNPRRETWNWTCITQCPHRKIARPPAEYDQQQGI